ncbi:MAG: hypothetical protein ACK5JM_10275 [Rhodoblastus sp.]
MFFLVKSAFWLALVFYWMNWPGGERPEKLARLAAGDLAQRAQTAAVDSAVSACKADPAGCLTLAQTPLRGAIQTPLHGAIQAPLRGAIAE